MGALISRSDGAGEAAEITAPVYVVHVCLFASFQVFVFALIYG